MQSCSSSLTRQEKDGEGRGLATREERTIAGWDDEKKGWRSERRRISRVFVNASSVVVTRVQQCCQTRSPLERRTSCFLMKVKTHRYHRHPRSLSGFLQTFVLVLISGHMSADRAASHTFSTCINTLVVASFVLVYCSHALWPFFCTRRSGLTS